MSIASNTGPLIALAKVDLLSILESLFGVVQIPQAVYRELLAKAGPEVGRLDAAFAGPIQIMPVPPMPASLTHLTQNLGAGEQEAIALAIQHGSMLLIDDRLGRSVAHQLGLRVAGTAGVLLEAKRAGVIPQVMPVLQEIRNRGYWLSDALLARVAELAGER